MQAFRNFFSSKIGLGVTLAFLALIALAFASSDVANTGTFGGVAGGDRVAQVGDRKIGIGEMASLAQSQVESLRSEQPTLTMEMFLAQDGLDRLLEGQFNRIAMAEFAHMLGLRAGDRLVGSEIGQIPRFRGPTGEFSDEAYRAFLQRQGITDTQLREDLADGLLARQIQIPIRLGAQLPRSIAESYAGLYRETRRGSILTIPSGLFAPAGEPSQEVLQEFYRTTRDDYIRPERRVVRYVSFGADSLANLPAPTDAQIAARYRENSAEYSAEENRSFTQVVVPTQAAANAIITEVRGGMALAQSARSKGLATAEIGPVNRAGLAAATSPSVAQAAFEAEEGAIATPRRGSLGFYVLQVDSIERRGGRSLADVRGEIAEQLANEQRRAALLDRAEAIEEQIEDGASLAQVARGLGLEITTTSPLLADGRVYGESEETAPEILGPALSTAFDMEENSPQITELARRDSDEQLFLIFDVSDIASSAIAPLAEIREEVIARYRLSRGARDAREVADRLLERIEGGATLAEAMAEEETRLPAPRPVNLSREELTQRAQQGVRIPPPVVLIFSMAEGTVKRLEGANNAAWFVIVLDEIAPGEVDDELVAQFRAELGTTLGDEYIEQFGRAARDAVGVERNEDAIRALESRLRGEN